MKKFIVLSVFTIFLASCQAAKPTLEASPVPAIPVASPTSADTDMLADSEAALSGIWYGKDSAIMFDIVKSGVPDANLMLSLYYVEPDPWQKIGTNTMNFENGKLTYLTGKGSCEGNPPATYEVHLVSHDGKIMGMRLVLVGEDTCTERRISLDGKFLTRVTP